MTNFRQLLSCWEAIVLPFMEKILDNQTDAAFNLRVLKKFFKILFPFCKLKNKE